MKVIEVKNISKEYSIFSCKEKNITLAEKLGTLMELPNFLHKKKESFEALHDVSFDVNKGDVLGIIGPNGAGKSTLLKIISGITPPTVGQVKIKGTIASLLEVGAGFHPELSGRDNIYLNAAILGISKDDIGRQFPNIVKFSKIEKFLDTPVKYYSSGMYIRLAFAVAAHINTDILLIDEVLAVGDYEFQKKCLNKINDITNNKERTIIFVSHNLEAIKGICDKTILLKNGRIAEYGETESIINKYILNNFSENKEINYSFDSAPGNQYFKLKNLKAVFRTQHPTVKDPVEIICKFWSLRVNRSANLSLLLYKEGQCVFNSISPVSDLREKEYKYSCLIPGNLLNNGDYSIKVMFVKNFKLSYLHEKMCHFSLDDSREINWFGKWPGAVRPKLDWAVKEID